MRFTRLKLQNWRNFKKVEIQLRNRAFVLGPNASGKSNLLDALRFLRDVADPQGGFQRAVNERGGVSKIRSLHAGEYSSVIIEVDILLGESQSWTYYLEFNQDKQRRALVNKEQVWRGGENILNRPDQYDMQDPNRRVQTALEQVNANKDFRELATIFSQLRYLHLVPQLVREPDRSVGKKRDPYGGDFLEQLAEMQKAQPRTFNSRLRRIEDALRIAVPQLKDLKLDRDVRGVPHLQGRYLHWRPKGGWQTEAQFSDGTLRLLGLLWVMLDGTAPLLLEEPELSLHGTVVRYLPALMAKLGRRTGRQIIVSTHSADLLLDTGIPLEEIVLLSPTSKGTQVITADDDEQILALVEGGLPVAEAVIPRTAPERADQLVLALFEN